ncbi:MAG: Hpt domain-containing protein [Atopobiaceae bacterium]|jgi:HPt (histidine-containing phosphotransfer) domain-containing protein|nr:Hpt domain-containing protein [Atopobiaceae bacterium]MCI2173532.1 Hpt domain-containing protein [Atopobiaceae bacterium]MCI2207527.1 Hpt domain-containing protein [Atopobiaceae bacterium]
MDGALLDRAGIDYADGVRRCDGDHSLYERLIAMFLDDDNMEQARVALGSDDWGRLFECAHEIKGMSGNLSMGELYRTSSEVVSLLKANDTKGARKAFAAMSTAYDDVIRAIGDATERQ